MNESTGGERQKRAWALVNFLRRSGDRAYWRSSAPRPRLSVASSRCRGTPTRTGKRRSCARCVRRGCMCHDPSNGGRTWLVSHQKPNHSIEQSLSNITTSRPQHRKITGQAPTKNTKMAKKNQVVASFCLSCFQWDKKEKNCCEKANFVSVLQMMPRI